MVRDRTIASMIGMALGIVAVAGAGLAAGIGLFPSLAISLFGMAIGGWLGERRHERKTASSGNRDGARTA